MSSSKNSNENNTQNSVVPFLPPEGPTIPNLADHLLRGPCWVAEVTLCPGLSPPSLWHLTTAPRGAIGCGPVSQSRAWVPKRKEDYPRPRLSNKQELLTARPQSLQSVKRRLKQQHLCAFTIYLQIPTMGPACSESCTQLPQHLCSLTNRGAPWTASESAPG